MMIAAGRLVLEFHNNSDTHAKRRQLEELATALRKRFNLSALEVADFDDPERCVLGFAAVIPEDWENRQGRDLVERICREIDATSFARVMVEDTDLIDFSG